MRSTSKTLSVSPTGFGPAKRFGQLWLTSVSMRLAHANETRGTPTKRRGRGQHDALDALAVGIGSKAVNWILDADIKGFFDNISHDWMMRFVEHRIGPRSGPMQRQAVSALGDRRVSRLIRGWLKAGVVENGVRQPAAKGTPQGAVISPLLANSYLHYAYDPWAGQWRGRHAQGAMAVVR